METRWVPIILRGMRHGAMSNTLAVIPYDRPTLTQIAKYERVLYKVKVS